MTRRSWYVLAVVAGILGALMAVLAVLSLSTSPREYVADRFARSPAHDVGDEIVAYRSEYTPSSVAAMFAEAFEPVDQYVDGSGVYLRYPDDAVVILPTSFGSVLLVERWETAYRRYGAAVGAYWGWGRGANVRGGGPGGGGK
jgi:hypothetical protein